MRSMQLQDFGQPLAQVLRDTPVLQGSEVLLKVGRCGVCHSDVHMQDGYFDLGGGHRMDLSRSLQLPRTLGHEIAGTVVAVGPDVNAAQDAADSVPAAIGQRRVVYPWIGCGTCGFCTAGDEQLCHAPRALGVQRDGGFADHVLVPHPRYLLDFDPLPEDQACTYACAGLTAYAALQKALPALRNPATDTLVIIGAGGVGLSAIRLATKLCERPPIVVELDQTKWDMARDAGAGELIDPGADDAAKRLIKMTGGGAAAAIDFVGAGASFAFGVGSLRKGGTLVCVGLFGGSTSVVPALLALKALHIVGSYVGSLAEMRALMLLARAGGLPAMPVTTQPLANATQVLEDLRAGRIRGRTVLVP